jgi:DNA-directed RNA polymerase subunit RPC12/RpoP
LKGPRSRYVCSTCWNRSEFHNLFSTQCPRCVQIVATR